MTTGVLVLLLLLLGVCLCEVFDDSLLQVYVVPHSHCDPGWLSTFEGYFESDVTHVGKNNQLQK